MIDSIQDIHIEEVDGQFVATVPKIGATVTLSQTLFRDIPNPGKGCCPISAVSRVFMSFFLCKRTCKQKPSHTEVRCAIRN
jgi:hypothetical protein